ncbi:protein strawberry notch homolog 1-like [Haliotis rufescens]|uniref:protein strawberry notch homolog 1-like n=1 Tax=Haliotis rufescens TaxID=6454 RepID=UPI00201EB1B1|nr:protein strawberry notch homolog 1-like [Haliotis rufescens]
MATEANNDSFDLLSAALDESGITGNDLADLSCESSVPSTSDYGSLHNTGFPDSPLVNGTPNSKHGDVNQADLFNQAMGQLTATSAHIKPRNTPSPVLAGVPQSLLRANIVPGQSPTVHAPKIIRVPSSLLNSSSSPLSSLPSSITRSLVQGVSPNQPRVITITRMGSGGNVGSRQTITLTPQVTSANSPKIIVASSNKNMNSISTVNGQIMRTSSPIQVVSKVGMSGGKLLPGSTMTPAQTSLLNSLQGNRSVTSTVPSNVATSLVNGNNINAIKTSLSNKDLSRLWSQEDVRLKNIAGIQVHRQHSQTIMRPPTALEEEEVEEEVEELGHAETYFDYMPEKLKLGEKHPDAVVETSSMASVEPPDINYKLCIPESVMDNCQLSALQLEAIVYSSQRHQTVLPSGERAGYLIGDGAGVGKGRTIAGIIYENYLQGRKRALWLSVSNDLKVDAERDLRDIGAGKIDVHPLNKFKYAKITSKENGSVKKGVIFSTYSSLIGESQSSSKYRTRLKQLLKWCGKDFDGLIVFDECHRAKNLCPVGSSKPTKTGQTVLELQNRLPMARVIYASATGASEPKNMAYMTRLGLWGPGTPFKEFTDFIQAVERRGVGAMELVAMDMKLRGMYIARQLSFKGVSFKIEEIPLADNFVEIYNKSVKLWVDAREKFQQAADLIDAEQRMRKSMWGQFWSAHQRFFKYLCISSKCAHCVQLARDAVKGGKCVVIGLQSTGEARTLEQLEEMGGELNDFVSTAKGVIQTLVEKHFPCSDRRKTFDMFNLGGHSNNRTNGFFNNNKRKKDTVNNNNAKKPRNDSDVDSSSDSDDSGKEQSDFDLSLSSFSDSDSESGDDNINPFGSGSDSDDDPWLKRGTKKKKSGSKKVKKEKKKKKKKEKKKKKDRNEDAEFDKMLGAAGLLSKNSSWGTSSNNQNGSTSLRSNLFSNEDGWDKAMSMKSDLLVKIEKLGDDLPPNTLDYLIDELGGPESVAEMTGRKGRVVSNDDGGVSYESRSEVDVPLEVLNLTEKQRFMDGEKFIAIISEAASSGISLQADRRVNNQRRRVHITLELPWSADRAIQQFGRTHRSNQVTAPEYVFMISELAGERRFASTVAKRLESLGALTHGDRRATESRDLSRFNIDNKYGRAALEAVMKCVLNLTVDAPLVPPPQTYKGDFFPDVKRGLVGVGMISIDERSGFPSLEKDYNNISKYLNRILGMEVELQNSLFKYFTDTLTAIILEAKRNGRWDMGILDLGSGGEKVHKVETLTFLGNTATNTAKTELTTVSVERGMAWNQAIELWRKCAGSEEGFYLAYQERNMKRTSILIVHQGKNKKKERLYNVYRPNTGLQLRCETLEEIRKKYKKVLPDEAQNWWDDQYYASAKCCSHAYWRGNCKKMSLGLQCEIGLRTRTYHVLSGSVLSVWSKVEGVLASMPGGASSKMQIIRLRTDDGKRIVGSLIPGNCVNPLTNILSQDSAKMYSEKHPPPREDEANLSMPVFF